MAIDIEKIKPEIAKVAQKHNLALVILYGSQATGKARDGSDVDIAVLGKKRFPPEQIISLYSDFDDVFKVKELDVKSLHNANSFFRYQVVKDGVLLYGDSHQYNFFKLYVIRYFQENKKMRELRDFMLKKRQNHLNKIYVGQRTY